jgi:hypothetical protein
MQEGGIHHESDPDSRHDGHTMSIRRGGIERAQPPSWATPEGAFNALLPLELCPLLGHLASASSVLPFPAALPPRPWPRRTAHKRRSYKRTPFPPKVSTMPNYRNVAIMAVLAIIKDCQNGQRPGYFPWQPSDLRRKHAYDAVATTNKPWSVMRASGMTDSARNASWPNGSSRVLPSDLAASCNAA